MNLVREKREEKEQRELDRKEFDTGKMPKFLNGITHFWFWLKMNYPSHLYNMVYDNAHNITDVNKLLEIFEDQHKKYLLMENKIVGNLNK